VRRVLVPIDGSDASDDALATIELMGDHGELEVVLVGMVEASEETFGTDPVHRGQNLTLTRCLCSTASLYLTQMQSRLRAQGIRARWTLFFGKPPELWDMAQLEGAEVMVPDHGPRGPRCSRIRQPWCEALRDDCPLHSK